MHNKSAKGLEEVSYEQRSKETDSTCITNNNR